MGAAVATASLGCCDDVGDGDDVPYCGCFAALLFAKTVAAVAGLRHRQLQACGIVLTEYAVVAIAALLVVVMPVMASGEATV